MAFCNDTFKTGPDKTIARQERKPLTFQKVPGKHDNIALVKDLIVGKTQCHLS